MLSTNIIDLCIGYYSWLPMFSCFSFCYVCNICIKREMLLEVWLKKKKKNSKSGLGQKEGRKKEKEEEEGNMDKTCSLS